jgi:hypothetical protein
MTTTSTWARVFGSTLAGAVGFFIGFYIGFFIVLSIWGLGVDEMAFVLATGVLGTVAAGGAIAFTVDESRRLAAFITAVGLGVVLVPAVLALNSDVVAIAIAGLLIVVATSALVRTGATDAIVD